MGFFGIDIIVVEDGHKLTCPKGVEYVVRRGEMVNNGNRKIYCTQPDYEKLRAQSQPRNM